MVGIPRKKNRFKIFIRTIKVLFKLGQRGLVLSNDDPLAQIVTKTIAMVIWRTNMTDDQIADLAKAAYDDVKRKDKEEKEEILKDAADVIEKWSKIY